LSGEDLITVGTNVPKELAELLDCIVMANTHRSKSDIVREALNHYLDNVLDRAVLEAARKIQELRHQTIDGINAAKQP
jgi:predicted DNA-binding protein